MKKFLLLGVAAISLLSAQKNEKLANYVATPFQFDVTAERNVEQSNLRAATTVNDTLAVAGTKSYLTFLNNGNVDPRDYELLYVYDDAAASGDMYLYWASQMVPNTGNYTMTGITFTGDGFDRSPGATTTDITIAIVEGGSTVYQYDTVIDANQGFVDHIIPFPQSVYITDTAIIEILPKAFGDTVVVRNSGDVSLLGVNTNFGVLGEFNLDNPALNYYALGTDVDWFIGPIVEFTIDHTINADITCLEDPAALTANFTVSEDPFVNNHVFNFNAFMINYGGGSKATMNYYQTVNYSELAVRDTADASGYGSFAYTFPAAALNTITSMEYYNPYGYSAMPTIKTSSATVVLDACATTSIEENNNLVAVYPNPATTSINVEVNENAVFTLYNVLGEVVKSQNVNQNATINVSDLNEGVYVYTINFQGGESATGRIVKQ